MFGNITDSNRSVEEGLQCGGKDKNMSSVFSRTLPEPSTAVICPMNSHEKPKKLSICQLLTRGCLQIIEAPFHYVSSLPSKGIRGKLLEALNVWVGASPKTLDIVTSIVADVHNLSLM